MRVPILFLLLFALPNALVCAYEALSLEGFSDSINHYRKEVDATKYDRYAPDQIVEIAENILLYQRDNGGWPKNKDLLRILSDDEKKSLVNEKALQDTTFDNRTTYTQIAYLAQVYQQTSNTTYADAARKGIAFILSAQYDNGGWPQFWPKMSGYQSQITINDDVLAGLLFFLRNTQTDKLTYSFVSDDLHAAICDAIRKADKLVLRLQIVVNGKRTVWAGQYDPITLKPATARSYELPSLISVESVKIVRYLMQIASPSPEVIEAIHSAMNWFEISKIQGMRVETFEIDPITYGNFTASIDRRVVEDPEAPPIWARFYEIDTNRPFMANRDGKKVYSIAEVEHERRIGYGWYTNAPEALLEKDYPEWKKQRESTVSP
jgi:PelA/Pel-15E family pectate lyase